MTLPPDQAEIDVLWNLKTGDNEVLNVPGRRGSSAYELDFILPRPQGSLQPLAAFGDADLSVGLTTKHIRLWRRCYRRRNRRVDRQRA